MITIPWISMEIPSVGRQLVDNRDPLTILLEAEANGRLDELDATSEFDANRQMRMSVKRFRSRA